jgi:hypothetical protein
VGSNRSLPNGPRPTLLTRPFLPSDPDPPHLLPTPLTRPLNCIPAIDSDAALRQCGTAVRQGAGPGGAGPQELGGPASPRGAGAQASNDCSRLLRLLPCSASAISPARRAAARRRLRAACRAASFQATKERRSRSGRCVFHDLAKGKHKKNGSTACAQDHTAPACA